MRNTGENLPLIFLTVNPLLIKNLLLSINIMNGMLFKMDVLDISFIFLIKMVFLRFLKDKA